MLARRRPNCKNLFGDEHCPNCLDPTFFGHLTIFFCWNVQKYRCGAIFLDIFLGGGKGHSIRILRYPMECDPQEEEYRKRSLEEQYRKFSSSSSSSSIEEQYRKFATEEHYRCCSSSSSPPIPQLLLLLLPRKLATEEQYRRLASAAASKLDRGGLWMPALH